MIHSMTAFSRRSVQQDWGILTLELRTVNHRYFELDLRLPEPFRELEITLRERIASYLKRGKIECHLKYKPSDTTNKISINRDLVKQLAKAGHEISHIWETSISVSLVQLLSWPGVLQSLEVDNELLHKDLYELFNEALKDIVSTRLREGQAIQLRIEERLDQILQEISHAKKRLPLVIAQQREKILLRMNELKLTIDPLRLEEELLLLIQKMDVSEEVERLEIHVTEVRKALNTEGAVGRRLDFLMQELHREANTLGSKSADAEITHISIRLKVLIEQMREQVQNVE